MILTGQHPVVQTVDKLHYLKYILPDDLTW